MAWDTIAGSATGGPLTVATALAYPAGDLVVMVLVLGAFALTGWRPDRGLVLIGAGMLVWGAAGAVLATGALGHGHDVTVALVAGAVLAGVARSARGIARAQGFAVAPPMPPALLGHWAGRSLAPR